MGAGPVSQYRKLQTRGCRTWLSIHEITTPWVQDWSPNTGDYKPVGAGHVSQYRRLQPRGCRTGLPIQEITTPWVQDMSLNTGDYNPVGAVHVSQYRRLQPCRCRTCLPIQVTNSWAQDLSPNTGYKPVGAGPVLDEKDLSDIGVTHVCRLVAMCGSYRWNPHKIVT